MMNVQVETIFGVTHYWKFSATVLSCLASCLTFGCIVLYHRPPFGAAVVLMALNPEFRIQSPRPETPEPESRQGRRNAQPGAQLLDDDGGLSEEVRASKDCVFSLIFLSRDKFSSNIASNISSQNIVHHPRH
jgi:hypothetical protein